MQDLVKELDEQRKTLTKAIGILKKRGIEKAETEKNYRIAVAKEILKLRDEGIPVTIISDLVRGKEEIADLKMKRDIAETMYESCLQKIYQTKLELGIIERQIEAERKGE
ncbi:hypothetical protein [Thermotalea metallivorans]|uniref:Uncharacterized protein n=1 Tax=Thermotalea metallivorans TaxID=520762 RepID=A0A140LCJ4_9FIRM|nr:hypothetical protein [Thermotalea metallivorans]KXG78269.1 hypothetical protein AN619_02440 [Thermotalea metallivorans]